MSQSSSSSLPWLLALGAGALLGVSAATQRTRLPALGGPKALLEGASPLPPISIAMSSDLVSAGGRLRETVGQVPEAIRLHLGFSPASLVFVEDLDLAPHQYAVQLRGVAVATGTVVPESFLALRTLGDAGGDLAGEVITDPLTGRRGVWITEQDAGQARLLGYDVLEPGFVMALHVDTVLRRHLHELLTREEAYRLLDRAKQLVPRTVEELTNRLEVSLVQQVLRALLREQVSLRDLSLVLELIADAARLSQDPAVLTELVRKGLARQISARMASDDGVLHVLPLGPRWESLREAKYGEPVVKDLIADLRKQVETAREQGIRLVLLAPDDLRVRVRNLLERDLPDLPVLSEKEADPVVRIETVGPGMVSARG